MNGAKSFLKQLGSLYATAGMECLWFVFSTAYNCCFICRGKHYDLISSSYGDTNICKSKVIKILYTDPCIYSFSRISTAIVSGCDFFLFYLK